MWGIMVISSALTSFSSSIRNEDETNSPRRALNETKTNWLRLVACYSNRRRNEEAFSDFCFMLTQVDKRMIWLVNNHHLPSSIPSTRSPNNRANGRNRSRTKLLCVTGEKNTWTAQSWPILTVSNSCTRNHWEREIPWLPVLNETNTKCTSFSAH